MQKGNGSPTVCVNNLLRIFSGEVPFERLKGMPPAMVDSPATRSAEIESTAQRIISNYEPRISSVKLNIHESDAANGHFSVEIII